MCSTALRAPPLAHQQVRLCDARASLAWDLIPAGYIDDVNDEVSELAAEVGSQVV